MGFDVERFLEPIDDDLKCSICLKLLEDPLATPCGHVFCAQCIVQWVAESGTCPLTCEQLAVDDLKRILPLTSLIARLNVRCANFRRGCPVILKVENQSVHLNRCQFKGVTDSKGQIMDQSTIISNSPGTCEFSQVVVCQKGCGLPLLYQEPNSHDCIKALQTQVASLQMKLTKMEHENDLVCERTVTREESLQNRILNLEKELHAYEIHALNFERKLREYRSQIGYLQKQLNIRSDQGIEETEVEVVLERIDGSLGFNIMGGTEVGSNSIGGGIVVSRVAEGGPASKSEGLKMNDEIIKVNDVNLSEASHEMAVKTIKNAESPIHMIVRRKIDPPIECEINAVVSTGTQTDMPTHDVDTDSGIHERFSPRQDELCLSRLRSLDDGTSSSECSHRRFNFSKDDLELLRMRRSFNTYEPKCNESRLSSNVTLLVQDVNYVPNGTDENSNVNFDGQSYVTAVSDQVYFDPELDYEYEEITLWFGNCDLGLTFCCGEDDESAVYICEIEPGSVAYLDGRIVMWDQVLKINDIPVGSIEDIEPLVYDSSETIKFLVARPAQEVQATLIGSEGNNSWEQVNAQPVNTSESNDYSIGVIHEEDEDAATVSSEKTTDKCEKDSGVGRTDESTKTESSEQDAGEETAVPQEEDYCKRIDALEQQINDLNKVSVDAQQESRIKENASRSSKSKSSDSSSNSRSSNNGNCKKSQNNTSKNKNDSPPRKEKDRSDRKKSHRDSSREHYENRDDRESREKQKYSDNHRRSRKLAHVDRNIRASYMRAVTTESMQQIAVFGSPDHSPTKSSSRKKDKKSSRDNINDQAGNNGQQNMEWKVKITRDGSQIYIRKRPTTNHRQARNKLLRERAQQLSEERKGLTTEDETVSVYQGRYWPRDMRRRQLQKVREARRKKSEKLSQRLSDSPHTNSGSESGKGRKDSIVELSHRRMRKTRDHHFDDFVTVQEILTQRNPTGLSCGPIHVTTV